MIDFSEDSGEIHDTCATIGAGEAAELVKKSARTAANDSFILDTERGVVGAKGEWVLADVVFFLGHLKFAQSSSILESWFYAIRTRTAPADVSPCRRTRARSCRTRADVDHPSKRASVGATCAAGVTTAADRCHLSATSQKTTHYL